ncbi:hypothetical protein Corgl_1710 [Coriobacterium glomerans PW2]|uniref:DZANK-type domain-containing protein n=1 Tax=Coriobacterium glomerans (strain ATCC 49209 / DSM 20642 / JCM 10262 / PW2) TaxID=700015 RepID=F2NB55_CORGP|nr:zinc ribbon domain-containing protein [Coriobacterium glomerans]AEB07806.1 hypothetical protein Corgl_1710 [Coriobacterium glomerans PW2]
MAFLDDMQSLMNRGFASASRAAGATKLKLERADLEKRRRELSAQLGASLYEETRCDERFRSGREGIYDAIAAIDERRATIDGELEELAAQTQIAQIYTCTKCGAQVPSTDSFCAGCGTPVVDIIAAHQSIPQTDTGEIEDGAPLCPACGVPAKAGAVFCVACGARLDESASQTGE